MKYQFEQRNYGELGASARNSFVKKVYSILSVQLGITALFVLLNIYSATFAYIQYRYSFLSWIMIAVSIISLIVLSTYVLILVASPRLCQTYPTNLMILGAFTIAESYIVSSICSVYEPKSVLLAAVATAAATFGITFYAMTTKQDFTKWMTSFYGKI